MKCETDCGLLVCQCSNCGKSYLISNGIASEIFSKTKECPNCKGVMKLVKDYNKIFYQNREAQYYSCSKCGNAYATSGGQLNDSKFNARRASDANTSEKGFILGIICGTLFIIYLIIVLIGYFIFDFFTGISFIILGILVILFILFMLIGEVFGNQFYF